jgi:uncharacterized protein (DUF2249 family)
MIAGGTTIAELLDTHPELVNVLADFNPHLASFRDRGQLKIMAPRITVAQAAGMAGVPAPELVAVLRRAVGEQVADVERETDEREHATPPDLAGRRRVHLDVRDDIRHGLEPFARIMAAVKELGEEEVLVLRAPFEPIPLYEVLGRRGLAHWTERRGADDWAVWFYRGPGTAGAGEHANVEPTATTETIIVDVRGLEPPQPMVCVLERLDRLQPGQTLLVIHSRRPMFLYPQLDERGFVHETRQAAPDRVEIRIRRDPGSAGGQG